MAPFFFAGDGFRSDSEVLLSYKSLVVLLHSNVGAAARARNRYPPKMAVSASGSRLKTQPLARAALIRPQMRLNDRLGLSNPIKS